MKTTTSRIIVLTAFVGLAGVSGCKKKKEVATPEVTAPAATGGGTTESTDSKVVTDGAAHELLLSLERVHFALDTSELTEPSREALVAAAAALEKLPSVSLYVEGHTDDRGTSEYNVALSERRAQAVVEYLTRLGVAPARLSILPFGMERPLATGTDDHSRAENRRVDFRVMDGKVELKLAPGTLFNDDGTPIK